MVCCKYLREGFCKFADCPFHHVYVHPVLLVDAARAVGGHVRCTAHRSLGEVRGQKRCDHHGSFWDQYEAELAARVPDAGHEVGHSL